MQWQRVARFLHGPALIPFYVPPQPFQLCVRAPPRPNKMDASSLAAAALAVAMEDSRSAAVRELMLDRERAAMANEDARSYLAQRHFIGSLQMPNSLYPPMTWREAYLVRGDDMAEASEIMRRAMMDAQRAEVVRPRRSGSSKSCWRKKRRKIR